MPKTGRSSFVAVDTVLFGEPGRISPPASLGDEEKRVFVDLVLSLPRDHFAPSDVEMITAWCEAVVLRRRTYQLLLTVGETDADGKATGAFNAYQQATKSQASLARALRLSPQSRRQEPPKRAVKPISYFERMELEGVRDDGDEDEAERG